MKIQRKQRTGARKRSLLLLFLAAALGAAYYLYSGQVYDQLFPVQQTVAQVAPVDLGQPEPVDPVKKEFAPLSEVPSRIVIDEIGVDAVIEPVGLTPGGMMDAPNSNDLVGWYDKSAKAGEDNYAMLLDGHYGIGNRPAVFRRLPELKIGSVIEIYGENGTKLSYEVAETERQYLEGVDMNKAFYPYEAGEQSLTIITCEGEYDDNRATYDKRTIVYAIRV